MNEHSNNVQFAQAEMLIRKPVEQVFQAFINPEITTKFWFTKSSGILDDGKEILWTWEMYNHSISVLVKEIIPNEKIVIEWNNYENARTTVEWIFKSIGITGTFVSITDKGFQGNSDKTIAQLRGSTEGFTLVLAGLKAYLEHGLELNLVADRFPKELGGIE